MSWLRVAFYLPSAVSLAAFFSFGCSDYTSTSNAVTLSGSITEVRPGEAPGTDPVGGVSVCEYLSNNCATSGETGFYELRVLKNRNVAISYRREGFGPVLVGTRSTLIDFTVDVGMATTETLEEFFDAVGGSFPPSASGYLTATTFGGSTPLAGVSYGLVGSDATSFYLDDDGAPQTSLLETQTPGAGGFTEVAPVDVDLTVSGAVNCAADNSWPAPATNTFRLPVRTGYWTQARIDCE